MVAMTTTHKIFESIRRGLSSVFGTRVEEPTETMPVVNAGASEALEILPSDHAESLAIPLLALVPEIPAEVVGGGYYMVFDFLKPWLPQKYWHTSLGVDIIHAMMEHHPATASDFKSREYAQCAAVTHQFVSDEETRRESKRLQRLAENEACLELVLTEIGHLFRIQSPLVKNYGKLLNHLRAALPVGMRGARGVRIINAGITKQVKWASHWTDYMRDQEERAVAHDTEYLKRTGKLGAPVSGSETV